MIERVSRMDFQYEEYKEARIDSYEGHARDPRRFGKQHEEAQVPSAADPPISDTVPKTREKAARKALEELGRKLGTTPLIEPEAKDVFDAVAYAAGLHLFQTTKRKRDLEDDGETDYENDVQEADSLPKHYDVARDAGDLRNAEGEVIDDTLIRASLVERTQEAANRPRKKIKRTAKPLEDISTLQPLQLALLPHSEHDRSDDWFQTMFANLFKQIAYWSATYYGFLEIDESEPWGIEHTPEFLRYVDMVAEADPAMGGWEPLLKETKLRQYLVGAVLARILEIKVFNELLWGANSREKELLGSLDTALVFSHEGFSRNALRSTTVRTIVGGSPVTEYFHYDVNQLTAQIMLLFKPLTDHMHIANPDRDTKVPKMKDHLQALHNIVSQAAWLSVAVRLSPTIIHFSHVAPGANFEDEEMMSLDPTGWRASKQVHVDAYALAIKPLKRNVRKAQKAYDALPEMIRKLPGSDETKAGTPEYKALIAAKKLIYEFPQPTQTHRAMAKICCWPTIRRYSPGSGYLGGEQDGFRIFLLNTTMAVFYYGKERRGSEDPEKVTATEYAAKRMLSFTGHNQPTKHLPAGEAALWSTFILAGCGTAICGIIGSLIAA